MYRQLPNMLTMLRLVLAAVFFLVLNQYRYNGPGGDAQTLIIWSSIVLFTAAALTDVLDGYLARRWKVESRFGRIMDPTVDKVLVMGAFIYLCGTRFVMPDKPPHMLLSLNMISGVYPWMVIIILTRELLVTAMRGEFESTGASFGANWFGKGKMLLQSITVPFVLGIVWFDPTHYIWMGWVRDALVYATVIITIISIFPYIAMARKSISDVEVGKDE